jgi:hypothetical protein
MKYKIFTFCLLHFFLSFTVFSQSDYKVELKDSELLEPISYATVRFLGTNRGLIADVDGQFRLPRTILEETKILEVSSIGYTTIFIEMDSLELNKLNVYMMKPSIITLDEVILKSSKSESKSILENTKKLKARQIVSRAVNAIKYNLDDKPHSYIGYYRDYQIFDNTYYNLNEGIIEQFDEGINTHPIFNDSNQSALYSFNRNNNFATNLESEMAYDENNKKIPEAKIFSFGGNELSILNIHNAIRNYSNNSFSFVYRMDIDFLKNHEFSKEKVIIVDDNPILEISFVNIKELTSVSHSVSGFLRVSLKDFSIYSFKYTAFDSNKIEPVFNLQIEYQRINKKMYLNYITFNNRFLLLLEGNVFKESNVIYDAKHNRFEITFNSFPKPETIKKRNFKIKYYGAKIDIRSVEDIGSKTVFLNLYEFDKRLQDMKTTDMANLELLIKKVKDIKRRLIYESSFINAYQFREYFVQEIFTNKNLDSELVYMNKQMPLKQAGINELIEREKYIINSPLQKKSKLNMQ